MSQRADHTNSLRSKINEFKDNYKIVIDVWYDIISNQDWDSEDIINMLSYSLHIDNDIDNEIQKYIDREKAYGKL